MSQSYIPYASRRAKLHENIQKMGDIADPYVVIVAADIEQSRVVFRQDSTFYYLSGVTEPATVLFSYSNGTDELWIPHYASSRGQWVTTTVDCTPETALRHGLQDVKVLGESMRGYSFVPRFEEAEYVHLIAQLRELIACGYTLVTVQSDDTSISVKAVFAYLKRLFPNAQWQNAHDVLAQMRRSKEPEELRLTQRAIDITLDAQRAAARAIRPGMRECEVQAEIERVFTCAGASVAFPSIVATGYNTTVLHYTDRSATLKDGDLVVVDIGAEWGLYAADITRTYPVSGEFTIRQREIYDIVLCVQECVAAVARPGVYLNNSQYPDISLQHIARAELEKHDLERFFVHGIGHFMGLDVHDVGDRMLPLRAGDVITIEPGVYLPGEHLGVRIEDDYLITDTGAVCLSASLPRRADEIERFMRS